MQSKSENNFVEKTFNFSDDLEYFKYRIKENC